MCCGSVNPVNKVAEEKNSFVAVGVAEEIVDTGCTRGGKEINDKIS